MEPPAAHSFNLDGTSIYLTMAFRSSTGVFGVHMPIGKHLMPADPDAASMVAVRR